MKKNLLFGALLVLNGLNSMAQSNSDDPIYNNPVTVNLAQPIASVTKSLSVGGMSINGEVLLCDSTSTVLTATGACSYQWFSDSLGMNALSSSDSLALTGISGDTTVYIASAGADTAIGLPLPPHSSVFTGNVRGYWFQAPSDFLITALTVPTDASTGPSNIAIFRFNSGPPPVWSTTTNDFTSLGLWQNETADTVFTCIAVDSGQYIGVLGNRADANSYATAPYMSTINGIPTSLGRLGMQFNLSTTAPQDVFSETGSSISRVELIYGNAAPAGAIYPVNVTAPQSSSEATTLDICAGDSVVLGGAAQTASGVYTDSLTSIYGCDSIVTTTLTVIPVDSTTEVIDLCDGDSLLINGVYVTTSGTYVDSLQTINGCDSLATMIVGFLAVDASASQAGHVLTASNASASYQWVDCDNSNAPISGATSQSYTATANGNYAVMVTSNGCTAMSSCFEVTTAGIDEYDLGVAFSIFPNPTSNVVNYSFDGNSSLEFVLTTIAGEILWKGNNDGNQGAIDLGPYAAGTYLLDVTNGNKNATIRLIKK